MTPQKKERRGSPLHCKLNMMHMPLCKKWYKMHVCQYERKHTRRGTLETSMYECGDERPRVAISGDTLFSLGYTMLVSWTMGDKHGNKRIYIDKQYMFNWRCYLLIFKNVRGYFTCYLLSLITTVSAWWLAKYPNGELTGALATNPVLHACTLQNSTHCK